MCTLPASSLLFTSVYAHWLAPPPLPELFVFLFVCWAHPIKPCCSSFSLNSTGVIFLTHGLKNCVDNSDYQGFISSPVFLSEFKYIYLTENPTSSSSLRNFIRISSLTISTKFFTYPLIHHETTASMVSPIEII